MIKLTDAAVEAIKQLMNKREIENGIVRLGVEAGGCSGLQYSLDFDERARDDDRIFEFDGFNLVCDTGSFEYLEGLELDHSSAMTGGGFQFHNPKASRTCGCGSSFRVEPQRK